MNSLSFTYRNKPKQYRAPANWNELNPVQLIRWAAVAFGDFDNDDKLRLAVYIMYNIEYRIYLHLQDHFKVQLFPKIEFLFKQCQVNKWLIKRLRMGFRYYYGPADKLTNLTANEFFNYTEVLYQAWTKTKADKHLNALCGILYRQKRESEVFDDIRAPLTDAGIGKRAKRFEKVHPNIKHAILLNYEGCRHYIITNNPDIFNSKGKIKRNKTPQDLVLSLSDGPFGNYEATKNANLFKFLMHINRVIDEREPAK
jgi:hypothetical protein